MKSEVYKEVLKTLEEKMHILNLSNEISQIKDKMRLSELSEKFDIPISENTYFSDCVHLDMNNTQYLVYFKDGNDENTARISWSDDGRQPVDEWLYKITYPCGAYTLDSEYPATTWRNFINAIKEFNPKYSDTHNNSFYFSSENAKIIYQKLPELFKKFRAEVAEELRLRKIKDLENELEKLKN